MEEQAGSPIVEAVEAVINLINSIVGPTLVPVLLLVGLFLTIVVRGRSITKIPYAFKQLFRKRGANTDEGDVSPFAALMTALSSTVGTGNIAGVAAAIAIGGPGAVFWMWVTAILGTATKYSEGVLAVRSREVDANGNRVGGPMYYIKNGLGPKWVWLGGVFAAIGMVTALGTGNSIQANSVADVLKSEYSISPWITALVLAGGAGAVILGGIKRIGSVASKVVPFMAVTYILAGLLVILLNIGNVPAAFGEIFSRAFGFHSAGTGISVGLLLVVMQRGVARGIFSNEAGQGSAPIAHAAAQNNDPVNQGMIAMLGTVIDTLFICTITALVILTSGVVGEDCMANPAVLEFLQEGKTPPGCETSAPLTASAFNATLSGIGSHIVAIGLSIFAFTTILGWSYYGERCAVFVFNEKAIFPYRLVYIAVVFFSALAILVGGENNQVVNLFWLMADSLTGLMAIPNLIALALLSPIVIKLTKEYFDKEKEATDGLIDQDDLPRGS